MKNHSVICITLVMVFCWFGEIANAQWRYTGLSHYPIPAIAVSGTDLYVGTDGNGVWYSASNGVGWNSVGTGLTGGYVHAFAVSPNGTGGTKVFAGTFDAGVFRTADSGAHWTAVNNGLTDLQVEALTVSGANLFAGTNNDGIFLSTDNGANWTGVNNGYDNTYTVYDFAVLGSNIFAGSLGGGIFRSTNNGTTWTSASSGLTAGNGMAILSFAVSGTNIFAATWDGVFLSANDGASWSSVSTGLTTLHINVLAVSGGNLYAGTEGAGVFRSTNNGASWTAVNAGLPAPTSIYALACLGTSVFAGGVNGGGIYVANQTTLTSVAEVEVGVAPTTLTLGDNYPNPFNPSTTIEFSVPQDGHAVLKVVDMLGREVATLFEGEAKSGYYQRVVFDASKVASGVYFSRLEFGGKQLLKKMLMMK